MPYKVFKLAITLLFHSSLLFFASSSFGQSIYINEFMASNLNSITDEFGDHDDWVELYNDDNNAIDIGGMFITDDLSNPSKWQIPTTNSSITTIPPKGYLLLWFDKDPEQGELHVDTKLSASGEDIALFSSDLTIIDSYSYESQNINISMGRINDGDDEWVFFSEPTPNEENSDDEIMVATPQASFSTGHYQNEIEVILTSPTPNAIIRYTTDGSEPSSSSSTYDDPLSIDESTTLRAKGFKSNSNPSRTMTKTYLFNVEHVFPIVCLSTDPEHFFDEDIGIYENVTADIENPVHAELIELDGQVAFGVDAGVKLHGGGSKQKERKGLAIISRNEYGDNQINYPIFPDRNDDEYKAFILRSSGQDYNRTLFRDVVGNTLATNRSDVGNIIENPDLDYQKYRPVIVYLNGEYFGIHNMREKLDWRYLERRYNVDKNNVDIIAGRDNPDQGDDVEWEDFAEYLEEGDFEDDEDLEELKTRIDLNNFFDNHILHMYVGNTDWPSNNNKRWRERETGEKWRFFTYDMDYGFGMQPLSGAGWGTGDWNSNMIEMVLAENSSENYNRPYSTLILRRVLENDATKAYFINRVADHLNTLFTADRVVARIDSFKTIYAPEAYDHFEEYDLKDWDEKVETIREFGENRTETMFDNFEDYFDEIEDQTDISITANPVHGGHINFSTLKLQSNHFPWEGTYFDGIDIPVEAVASPGYLFQNWSIPSIGDDAIGVLNLDGEDDLIANFVLGSTESGNIVINEINYNSPALNNSGDWIELYNAGSEDIDISGWIFEAGEDYFNLPANTTLAADAYLVIAEDLEIFQSIYPNVTNVIGSFGKSIFKDFKLSNKGELIQINNADRSFRDTVEYDDKLPWPEEPDGTGPSLQLLHHSLDNALPESWKNFPATPGEINPFFANLICPESFAVEIPSSTQTIPINWETPLILTNCDQNVSDLFQISGPANGSSLPVGVTTIEYAYQTACGVNPTCNFTITVVPQNAEINLTCNQQDITLSSLVGSDGAIVNWETPSATSNCTLGATSLDQTSGLSNGSLFPVGNTLVTYQAQDACDNLEVCSFTVTIEQEALTSDFSCPDNIVLSVPIGASGMIVSWLSPNGETNCEINSSTINQTSGLANGSFFPKGLTNIAYEYVTGCNLNLSCAFTITIEGEDAQLSYDCPNDIRIPTLVGEAGRIVTWDIPEPTSNCFAGNATLLQTTGPNSGSFFTPGITTITYQISHPCDNIETCSFEIEIEQDEFIFSLDCQNDITLDAPIGATGMIVQWDLPDAQSNCEISNDLLVQTIGPENGSFFSEGTTLIEYNYNTGCENNLSCNFEITINTEEAVLELDCPDNIIVNAPVGLNEVEVNWQEPLTFSNCSFGGAELEQTVGPQNGTSFPIGTYFVSFQSQDNCNNNQSCSFEIQVQKQEAILNFECPENITINAPIGANNTIVEWSNPDANSNCSFGNIDINQTQGLANGGLFPIGNTLISYQAQDDCDNELDCSFQITVIGQEALLQLSCPDDITVNAPIGVNSTIVEWSSPDAISDCSFGSPDLDQIQGLESGDSFPLGTSIVSYQAQDDCDNELDCSFQITVIGQEALLQLSCPDDIIVNAPIGINNTIVEWAEPNVFSDCSLGDININQIQGPNNGDSFPIGNTFVTYQVEDDCDNEQECSFQVLVIGQEATLQFSCPENITRDAPVGVNNIIVEWPLPSAISDCSIGNLNVNQIQGPNSGDFFPIGNTIITYMAEDDCDNEQTCLFNITVNQEALTYELTCPSNLVLNAPIGAEGIIVSWQKPIGTTNCEIANDELLQITGPVNGSFFPIGSTTIEYTYATGCDVQTSCNFTLTVNGQDAVLNLECAEDLIVNALIGASGATINWDEPIIDSDCSLGEASFLQIEGLANGSEFPIGTTIVSYQGQDPCENETTCSFSVIVEQEELTAELNCPEDLNFIVQEGQTGLVVNWPDPTSNTNCELAAATLQQTQGPPVGSLLPLGITTIEYIYNTGCETELTCSFDINVSVESTTSILDLNLLDQQISLFPNPADQILNIDISQLSMPLLNYRIYNSLGQQMDHSDENLVDLISVDVTNYQNAVYLVLFQFEQGIQISKPFVVHR